MQAAHKVKVNGRILWANLHLLFWLSLTPFVTSWMGENHFAPWPVALYGVVLLLSGGAFTLLLRSLIAHHGKDSILARAAQKDIKGKLSGALYVAVAIMWLAPDRRIERILEKTDPSGRHPCPPAPPAIP